MGRRKRNKEHISVSVYEGIERKKVVESAKCIPLFRVRKEIGRFMEEALTELERRYHLTETKKYLHGDGAPWIKQWFARLPN